MTTMNPDVFVPVDRQIRVLQAQIKYRLDFAPANPPAYQQTLRYALRRLHDVEFAMQTAESIARGGTPVPEELRNDQ